MSFGDGDGKGFFILSPTETLSPNDIAFPHKSGSFIFWVEGLMAYGGYVKIHRSLLKHRLWRGVFTRGQAWVDLILLCDYQTGLVSISLRDMAERWSWSLKQVRVFLKMLEEEKMIERPSDSLLGLRGTDETLDPNDLQEKGARMGTVRGSVRGTVRGTIRLLNYNNLQESGARGGARRGAQLGARSSYIKEKKEEKGLRHGHPLVRYHDYIYLTEPEYKKLCDVMGSVVEKRIEAADEYIGMKGKQHEYKDHYRMLMNWWKRDHPAEEAAPRVERLWDETGK
jgi:hypothetical protein